MGRWLLPIIGGLIAIGWKAASPYVPQDGWWNADGFEKYAPFTFNIALPFLTGYLIAFIALRVFQRSTNDK